MPAFTPVITNILLVNINVDRLNEQLELHGYKPVLAPDIECIGEVDVPYSLMIINEDLIRENGAFNIEHLYFLNNNVPTAVFISDPKSVPETLLKFLSESTLEWVYSHEIESGLICSQIGQNPHRVLSQQQFSASPAEPLGKRKIEKGDSAAESGFRP